LLSRSYHYTTMETVADQAYVTRYKCCAGWIHLPGENGCTYRKLVLRVSLCLQTIDCKIVPGNNSIKHMGHKMDCREGFFV